MRASNSKAISIFKAPLYEGIHRIVDESITNHVYWLSYPEMERTASHVGLLFVVKSATTKRNVISILE
jgi:hypothetical protein